MIDRIWQPPGFHGRARAWLLVLLAAFATSASSWAEDSGGSSAAELRELQDKVRAEQRALQEPGDPGPRDSTLEPAARQAPQILARSALAIERHLDALAREQAVRERRETVLAALDQEAERIREDAPLPIDEVDALWAQALSRFQNAESLGTLRDAVFEQSEDARATLNAELQRQRQLTDRLKTSRQGDSGAQEALRSVSLAEMRVREARLTFQALEAEAAALQANASLEALRAERLKALGSLAARLSPLSQRELDEKVEAAATAIADSRRRIASLTEAASERHAAVAEAGTGSASEVTTAAAQALLDTQNARAALADLELRIERVTLLGREAERNLWQLRYRLQEERSRDARTAMASALREAEGLVATSRNIASSEARSLQPRLDALNRRLEGGDVQGDARSAVLLHRNTLREMRESYSSFEAAFAALGSRLEVVALHAESLATEAGALDWIRDAVRWLAEAFSGFWSYELFIVEDSIEVDGQVITGQLGITVWKVISALLLVTLGVWLAVVLGRFLRRILLLRGASETAAALGYRLFNIVLVFVLFVVALSMVNIPFTTFSFLGGALAIGIGFGAQNLVNNFISGVILLMERPIEIGHIIEVDGIRGTVRKIGARFSQIRRFDGVDLLVPNSLLLEQKVTNLTLEDQSLRVTIRVGVAYGTPTREASQRILEAAEEHGLVMKDPPPFVVFEEFGDSALVFTLFFWVALDASTSWLVIASDVRHMIDRTLREAGITISFPQRDVHVDVKGPVAVTLEDKLPNEQR